MGYIVKGKLNSALSKAIEKNGGKYSKTKKTYYLSSMPPNIQVFLHNRNNEVNGRIDKILQRLDIYC